MSGLAAGAVLRTTLPRWLTAAVVLGSLLPAACLLLVDLGQPDRAVPPQDLVAQGAAMAAWHALFEGSSMVVALAVALLGFAHFAVQRDLYAPVLGTGFLVAGLMDGTHVLATIGLIEAEAPMQTLCPLSWATARASTAAVFALGLGVAYSPRSKGDLRLVALLAVGVSLASVYTIRELGHSALPQALFSRGFLARPFDLVPSALFLGGVAPLAWVLYRRTGSVFVQCILLSVAPTLAGEAHMLFGSRALFDSHDISAHVLKLGAYALPLIGVTVSYVDAQVDARHSRVEVARASASLDQMRRDTSQEIWQSELRFRTVVEQSHDPVFVIDPSEDRVLHANPAACALLGYTRSQLVRMSVSEVHPDEMSKFEAFARQASKPGGARVSGLTCVTRDRRLVPAEISGAFFTDVDGRRLMVAQVRDLTERLAAETRRRTLESELERAQRLEALGRLAGGVAHDFNNMLTVIIGAAAELKELDVDATVSEQASTILDAGQRSATLTRELLAFGRRQVLRPETVHIGTLLRRLEGMLRRLIPESIELRIEYATERSWVTVDPGQLDQVVLNLAVNARDAMPDGGLIEITVDDAAADLSEKLGLAPDDHVALSVRDTGRGLPPDSESRIFEPFFSTKRSDLGTGLGLSTVHGIVEQSGGRIEVESRSDRGTRFTVLLPRAAQRTGPGTALKRTGRELAAGTGAVLLVEDDHGVRAFAHSTLVRGGYEVLVASGPDEALRVCREHSGPIDVLVTDVVMPAMSGPDLAREIGRRRPDVRIVLMSGYATGNPASSALEGDEFVQKPFTRDELLGAVGKATLSAPRREPVASPGPGPDRDTTAL